MPSLPTTLLSRLSRLSRLCKGKKLPDRSLISACQIYWLHQQKQQQQLY